ncbi:MAG: response regulator transcription factor [Verrucomicrobiota bacterium]
MRRINVQIVEDHPAIQLAIRNSLDKEQYYVRHCAVSVEEAESQAAKSPIDITILDLNLQGNSGEALLESYRKNRPNIRILIYSATVNMQVIDRCIENGAYGYVRKCSPLQELITAIDKIAINDTRHIPHELAAYRYRKLAGSISLTPREKEVAQLVASGYTNQVIAGRLNISERTVNIHRSNMMRKIDAHTASEVTVFALESGLIMSDDVTPAGIR